MYVAGLGFVAVLLGVRGVDAQARQEALVPVVVNRDDLVVKEIDEGNGRLFPVQLGRGPLADQLAGGEVVGGERDVGGVCRVRRRVQGDDEEPGVLGLLQGVHYGRAVGGDQDALVALGDGVLDGLDLGVLVAVSLAGCELQVHAAGFGGLLCAVLHGDEERVGGGLNDQGDADLFGGRASG